MRAPRALAFRAAHLTPRTLGLNQNPVTLNCLILPPSPPKALTRGGTVLSREGLRKPAHIRDGVVLGHGSPVSGI